MQEPARSGLTASAPPLLRGRRGQGTRVRVRGQVASGGASVVNHLPHEAELARQPGQLAAVEVRGVRVLEGDEPLALVERVAGDEVDDAAAEPLHLLDD